MEEKIKILLAEDEISLGLIIKESLESRNFVVTHCENGEKAWEMFQKRSFDALVLDVMMPEKDGFSLAKDIRILHKSIPIVFLTAKTQTQDVLDGFSSGCNDYLKKPFSMEELIVRIQSLVQRKNNLEKISKFEIGAYKFDSQNQILEYHDNIFKLTHKEAALLEILLLNKNTIINRSDILSNIWGNDDFFSGRSLDVFITRLRKKLNLDTTIEIINLRGRGYKLIG